MSKTETLIKIGDLLDECKSCPKSMVSGVPAGGWDDICGDCRTYAEIKACREDLSERPAHQRILAKGGDMKTKEIEMMIEDGVEFMQIRKALNMSEPAFRELVKNLKRGGNMELTKGLYKQHKTEGMTDKQVMKKYGMHPAGLDRWKRKNLTDEERATYQLKKGALVKATENIAIVPENAKIIVNKAAKPDVDPLNVSDEYVSLMADLEKHVRENGELRDKLAQEKQANEKLRQDNSYLEDQLRHQREYRISQTNIWQTKYTEAEKERLALVEDQRKAEDEIKELKIEINDLKEQCDSINLQNNLQKQITEPMRQLLKVIL